MHGRRVTGALEKPVGNEERKANCAGQLVRRRRKKMEQALHGLTREEKKGPTVVGFWPCLVVGLVIYKMGWKRAQLGPKLDLG